MLPSQSVRTVCTLLLDNARPSVQVKKAYCSTVTVRAKNMRRRREDTSKTTKKVQFTPSGFQFLTLFKMVDFSTEMAASFWWDSTCPDMDPIRSLTITISHHLARAWLSSLDPVTISRLSRTWPPILGPCFDFQLFTPPRL